MPSGIHYYYLVIHFYSSSSEKTLTQKSTQMMQPTVTKKKLLQPKPEGRNQRDRSEDLSGQILSPVPSMEASDHLLSSCFLIQKNLTQAFTGPKYQRCLIACSLRSTAKRLFLKQTFPCRVLDSSQPWESRARSAEPAQEGKIRRCKYGKWCEAN